MNSAAYKMTTIRFQIYFKYISSHPIAQPAAMEKIFTYSVHCVHFISTTCVNVQKVEQLVPLMMNETFLAVRSVFY